MKCIYTLLIIIVGVLPCNAQAEESSSVRIDTNKLYRGLLLKIQINDLPVFIVNRRLNEINVLRKAYAESIAPVNQCPECDPILRSISPNYLVIWGYHPDSGCELIYISSTAKDSVGYKVHGIGGFIEKCSATEYDLTGRKIAGPSTSPDELGMPSHRFHDEVLEIDK